MITLFTELYKLLYFILFLGFLSNGHCGDMPQAAELFVLFYANYLFIYFGSEGLRLHAAYIAQLMVCFPRNSLILCY